MIFCDSNSQNGKNKKKWKWGSCAAIIWRVNCMSLAKWEKGERNSEREGERWAEGCLSMCELSKLVLYSLIDMIKAFAYVSWTGELRFIYMGRHSHATTAPDVPLRVGNWLRICEQACHIKSLQAPLIWAFVSTWLAGKDRLIDLLWQLQILSFD